MEQIWRVAKITEVNESHILKLVPYKHDRFFVSFLVGSSTCLDNDKYPGIPLSRKTLRLEEEHNKIACVTFTLIFKDSEGK